MQFASALRNAGAPGRGGASGPGEILSVERLEVYAENLARTQEVFPTRKAGISFSGRLKSNAIALNGAFQTLVVGIRKGETVTPAAAWLVDNFYIIDEHLKAIRRDLPPGYYKQLPKLANGTLRGYPRVYGIAAGLVDHTDNRFELDTLYRYVQAYQRIQPLTIGELWAIAITLRVILIDNLAGNALDAALCRAIVSPAARSRSQHHARARMAASDACRPELERR